MERFSALKKNLKKDFTSLPLIRVALLGDTATQFLVQALRGVGYEHKLDLQIWEAGYNQVERQVFDPSSELYQFDPQIVIVFQSAHKFLQQYNLASPDQYCQLAHKQLARVKDIHAALKERSTAKLIYYNLAEIDDAVFGSHANKTTSSFLFQLRSFNYELMLFASNQPDLFICDISSVQNRYGKTTSFQPAIYVNTESVFSLEVLPEIASRTVSIIGAMHGKFKKCLVLDLDNTLWGGVIGDDGMENIQIGSLGIGKCFTELQHWVKKLKHRGILLAVCSKNTEHIAKAPFEQHPDMVLRLDDIAIFVANWETKVDNIRRIQAVLNISFDSMVFLDDNPFERNMVRDNIPGITVPELPEDPALYLEYLYEQQLFETVCFSQEDSARTDQYQVEAKRVALQKTFVNEGAFLESLDMVSVVTSFDKFNIPRVAQLSQRSNQFNLRTIRYTEAAISTLANTPGVSSFTFSLADKFGDHGMICVVVLVATSPGTLFIDTWMMSCRVLKRGMENFVLDTLVVFCKEQGIDHLIGEYLPTEKNELVKDHYRDLGFTAHDSLWKLDINRYQRQLYYIKNKSVAYESC